MMHPSSSPFGRSRRVYALGSPFGAPAIETRERRTQGTATAARVVATTGGVIAAIPVVPWTQIAGGIVSLVGAGISLGALLRRRGTRALAGDKAAVRGFAKRAGRWSSARRARKAKAIFEDYKRLKAKLARKQSRNAKRQRIPLKKKLAIAKLKLEVLYGVEAASRMTGGRKQPVIADDPQSAPDMVDADPSADVDQPYDTVAGVPGEGVDPKLYWLGAATISVVAISAAAFASRRSA